MWKCEITCYKSCINYITKRSWQLAARALATKLGTMPSRYFYGVVILLLAAPIGAPAESRTFGQKPDYLLGLRRDRTVQEIAAKHKIHPNQVGTWKR